MKTSFVLLSMLTLALAGCGGSGGSGNPATLTRLEAASLLNDRWKNEARTQDMPDSGQATYKGAVLIGSDVDMDKLLTSHKYLGDATLTAQFTQTGGTVTGGFDNFQDADGAAVSGSILLDENAQIIGHVVTAGVNGTIDGQTVRDGDLTGEFLGAGAGGVSGTMDLGGTLHGGFVTQVLPQ